MTAEVALFNKSAIALIRVAHEFETAQHEIDRANAFSRKAAAFGKRHRIDHRCLCPRKSGTHSGNSGTWTRTGGIGSGADAYWLKRCGPVSKTDDTLARKGGAGLRAGAVWSDNIMLVSEQAV